MVQAFGFAHRVRWFWVFIRLKSDITFLSLFYYLSKFNLGNILSLNVRFYWT